MHRLRLLPSQAAILSLLGCHRHCGVPSEQLPAPDARAAAIDDAGSVDAQAVAPHMPPEIMRRAQGPSHERSVRSLELVDRDLALAEKHGFRPIDESTQSLVDAHAAGDSRYWMPRFLLPEASPYRPGLEVRRSLVDFPSQGLPDTLRHEYTISVTDGDGRAHRLHLVVTETYYDVRIAVEHEGVDLLTLAFDERVSEISWIAAHVIALHGTHHSRPRANEYFGWVTHDWVFLYDTLNEGSKFSTAPTEDLVTVWSWAYRVDGGISKGRVYFLGHKFTNGHAPGIDPSLWFESPIDRKPPEDHPTNK